MSGVLLALLWAAVAVVTFIAAVLATPVKLDCAVRTQPRLRLKLAARLFGGLTPSFRFFDSEWSDDEKRSPKNTPPKRKKARTEARLTPASARRIAAATPSLLTGLLRPIRLERLRLDADIGLFDPADTGHVYGMLTPLIYATPPSSVMSISVRPDFDAPRLAGEVDARLRFIPLAFAPPAIRFAWRVFGPGR